jgi:hypothetical protein
MTQWHQLLGLTLADFFTGTPYQVEIEKDLPSTQTLDIVIIKKEDIEALIDVPDGLEDLNKRNLLTFKSIHEPLDSWVLTELLSYYVIYRKMLSKGMKKLVPENEFQLYGLSARKPEKLFAAYPFNRFKDGIYKGNWADRHITIIVPKEVLPVAKNALWLLFSGEVEKVKTALSNYQCKIKETIATLLQIRKHYNLEGIMAYTFEDLKKVIIQEDLPLLTVEERFIGLTLEDRLRGLKPEDRLRGLKPEDRLRGLKPEERLEGLTSEEIELYLKKLKQKTL